MGMGHDLYEAAPHAREVFDLADDLLDIEIKSLCFNGPEELLKQTAVTQPGIFIHSIASLKVLESRGHTPNIVAGHSVGELAALVAAGVMSFEDGLRVVCIRGQAMQTAGKTRPGAMAAILGLSDNEITQLCNDLKDSGHVTPANFNCPGQVVISGEAHAVTKAIEKAKKNGAKRALPLPVSAAFHSTLMQPAVNALIEILNDVPFAQAQIPVVPNVTTEPTRDPAKLKDLLIQQAVSPVRWTESMQTLITQGVTQAFEVGPGNVLKGLMRRIDRNITVNETGTMEAINKLTP